MKNVWGESEPSHCVVKDTDAGPDARERCVDIDKIDNILDLCQFCQQKSRKNADKRDKPLESVNSVKFSGR